jgi:uncharacterized protein (DUF885 family)
VSSARPVTDPNAAVAALADRFWEGVLERDPFTATLLGDDRYDDRLPDLGPRGRDADARAYREVLTEVDGLGDAEIDTESLITRDMLALVARNGLEALEARLHQLSLDHIGGPQTWPAKFAQYGRADSASGLENLLARYAGYPEMIDQYIGTLAEGVDERRTAAQEPVMRAIEQVGRMLETPVAESPAVTLARVSTDDDRERLRAAAEAHIYPALRALHDYLAGSYRSAARLDPGISSTPNGEAAYALSIRLQTTVAATPQEVHEFGLADLESIEAEKDEIAHRLGHADRHALAAALRDDPANHTDDPNRIVELAKEQTARAFGTAPRYFGRLPRADCEVMAVESYRERESPPAFYMPPSLDGSRAGQYYLNTFEPRERQLHKIAAITFHEATPGHHFQIAIEQELEGLPAFRTLGSRMAGVAYVEGWGLYTERLADEMGLYASDAERLGMLEAQAFRAARLVVDSGLHAFGWSRDQAIAFMHERGSLPMVDAAIEVDRYIIWPGQALAYKIGQREIERARDEVRAAMGKRFDLRAFHDEVLAHGSLPLETLRREIPAWVEAAVSRS